MEKLTVNQMETTKGGKFIGTTEDCSPCQYGFKRCTKNYYLFWICYETVVTTPGCQS
jgi:hypothetical protein